MIRLGFRGWFCLAVAVAAATLADPLLEAASNAGWFGRAEFTDHSNLDILPAFLVSAALALLYVYLQARPIVEARSNSFARWFNDSARGVASRPLAPLLPAIFSMQMIALFAMETIEQVVVAGHPLGGTLWLGAPVAIALGTHASICVAIAYALARVLDALTTVAVELALLVHAMFVERPRARSFAPETFGHAAIGARMNPLASRAGKRAPPSLLS